MLEQLKQASHLLKNSRFAIAFTGAGISAESGIPPFRGKDGLWSKYDPDSLYIERYYNDPINSWKVIKEIFYDFFGEAKPNKAHLALAELEKMGLIKVVITQNIDNLHYEAGSKAVYEFHGNSRTLVCTQCDEVYDKNTIDLNAMIPLCPACDGLLKPNFIFFGEAIPEPAGSKSFELAQKTDLIIVIGTTGEVMPACNIPIIAKRQGAKIIEINPERSNYTERVTDVFLQGKASEIMSQLLDACKKSQKSS
jgi:NAD-dependent deacetylase